MLIKKLFVSARQASLAKEYRNARIKINIILADIYFNKQCLKYEVIPKYARITIKSTNIAANRTIEQAQKIYVKNMIRQLYSTKDNLNIKLYSLHLQFQKEYGLAAWNFLSQLVKDDVDKIMEKKYHKIENKLRSLRDRLGYYKKLGEASNNYIGKFQSRVVNMTNVVFNNDEMNILNYGPKHNFQQNNRKKIEILATDIETNIKSLKHTDQNEVRYELLKSVKKFDKEKMNMKKMKEWKICTQIKKKIEENDIVATKVDKSNAIALIDKSEYIKKTEKFITENNFKELGNDPTEKYKKQISKTIDKCNLIVPKEDKYKVMVSNTKAPVLRGIPKIHKLEVPVRPLINFQKAPTYNLSKLLAKTLTNELQLENHYIVKNSYELVEKLKSVKLTNKSRFISFDISNMYTNIPVKEVIAIIEGKLKEKQLDKKYISQLVELLKNVLSQNYFRFNNKFYIQNEGLAMGSPLSAILSEIFLQEHEELILKKMKMKHDIVFYARYVDDTFIIIDEKLNNEVDIIQELMNGHHKNLKYTYETEEEQSINFLDLTVTRLNDEIKYKIYRKPTQTDTVINNDSIHPFTHKTASFRSMLYRTYKIPMNEEDRKREIEVIKHIATVNGYKPTIIDGIAKKIKRKIYQKENLQAITTLQPENMEKKKTFVTFNYTGENSQRIANGFKKYDMSIAYKTGNNLINLIQSNVEDENKFNRSGIYKLNCNNCDKYYIGQTVNFNNRFKEHMYAWKKNKPERSNFGKHLLDYGHNVDDIKDNMEILKICNKGRNMTSWEELFIYKGKLKEKKKLINEQINFESDRLYGAILEKR